MKISCRCILKLDIQVAVEDGLDPTFILNPNLIVQLKNSGKHFYDILEFNYLKEVEEIEMDEFGVKILFIEELLREAGPFVNRFYLSLSRNLNLCVTNIYNGDDFIVPFIVVVLDEEGKKIGGYDASSSGPAITKEKYQDILDDFNFGEQDIIEQLKHQASDFLNLGFIDMALLTAYIALEVAVKRKFNRDLFKNENDFVIFRSIPDRQFINKYLNFGPYLCYGKTFQEFDSDTYHSMIDLDRIRNKIAHEGTSKHDKLFVDTEIEEIYDNADDLIDYVEETIKWLDSLDCEFAFYEIVEIVSDDPKKNKLKNKTGRIIDIIKNHDKFEYLLEIKDDKFVIRCLEDEIIKSR